MLKEKPAESARGIEGLAESQETRASEYRQRSRNYVELSVTPGAIPDYEKVGWTFYKEQKNTIKIRQNKSQDENLENRFWCCMYRLGYSDLNIGRNFRIALNPDEDNVQKQIDVYAKDDETIVVAECKTAESHKKRSLQLELGEFDSLKKPISSAIRRHYGASFKPKIIWCFVTEQIEWTTNDLARAEQHGTRVITERDLDYIEELSKVLGPVARNQFKATYLEGQKIPQLQNKKLPAVKCKIGGRMGYVFSARASDILPVAFVNHRDFRDPRGTPSYQRFVNPGRLKKIASFLEGGGYFPNSILLNFRKKPRFEMSQPSDDKDIQFGHLYLPETYKSCWVVDGQHRLYGCALLGELIKPPTLAFMAFEGISPTEEAILFATINREQQKVQPALLDELDGDLKWDSEDPQEWVAAIASRAIDLMNNRFGSPFDDCVSPPGIKNSEVRPLTLPEIRKSIISAQLIGYISKSDKIFVPGPFYTLDKEKTLRRVIESLEWYFKKIRTANPARWDAGKEGKICSNFGVPGHIRFLSELLKFVSARDAVDVRELSLNELDSHIGDLLNPVLEFIRTADEDVFDKRFSVSFGSGGIKQYFFMICQLVNGCEVRFCPAGFEAYVQDTSAEQQASADKLTKLIQDQVHGSVITRLKDHYGKDFFDKGISNKQIRMSAHNKRIEDDSADGPNVPEFYLDFLDLKKIVESKENWPLFADVFNIQMPSEKKGNAKYVKWFDEVNRIRRISAHPFGRTYKQEDIDILNLVSEALDLKQRVV